MGQLQKMFQLLQFLTIWIYLVPTLSFTIADSKASEEFAGELSSSKIRNELKDGYGNILTLHSRQIRSQPQRRPLPSYAELNNFLDNVKCPTERCYCIKKDDRYNINCKYQQLNTIPSFTVTNLSYYELTFNTYNYITTIPTHAFHNINVERIDLLTNKISNIESGAFAGLESSLKELFIQGNGKIPVPYEKMLNLVNLRSLHLLSFTQNTIQRDNYFGYFPKLEMLAMEDIKDLSYIDSEAFKDKLAKLKLLRFKNVAFGQLPKTGLSHLKQLQTLDIQDTNIKTIYDRSFPELNNLRNLDLSYNRIDNIQDNAFEDISQHLLTLILSNNYLSPSSLRSISSKPWNNLKTLSLSYNSDLRDFPGRVFQNMPQLHDLNLVETNLKTVNPNTFMGLDDLERLDLSWNKIETIGSNTFKHMTKLKHLKLDNQFNNGFSISPTSKTQFSPESFAGIERTLEVLELQNTMLLKEQLWKVIPSLVELREVDVTQTKVSNIPEYIFENNIKLEQLHFDKNNVTIKPASFRGLEKSLKKISLKDNSLTTISECAFQGFTELLEIQLVGNPLHCDCKLQWLKHFIEMREKTETYLQKEYYVCATPTALKGRKLYNISYSEMGCTSYIPEDCNFSQRTTTVPNSSTLPSGPTLSSTPSLTLSFTLAGITSSSITVAWSISEKEKVTGYNLKYFKTSSKTMITMPIHRDGFTYTVQNLESATFYTICLTPEVNGKQDEHAMSCQTVQTKLKPGVTDEQSGTKLGSSDGPNYSRNTILGIGLACAAVFILILVGVCMVVKYKMQKLKVIQWSIGRQVRANMEDGIDGLDKLAFGTTPNEYMEIDNARLVQKHKGKSPKGKDKQFDDDPTYNDRKKYASCKTARKKRHNPYENDDESDEEKPIKVEIPDILNKEETNEDKAELQLRYSAPSRLEAKQLLNYNPRFSRPLPALPQTINKSKTLDRRSKAPAKDTNKARVFVTQCSVYEQKVQSDQEHAPVKTGQDSPQNDTVNMAEKEDV